MNALIKLAMFAIHSSPSRVLSLATLILVVIASPVLAMTYPDPAQVAADIPDKKTRAAAFVVLLTQVNHNGLSEDAASKYQKALSDLDPPWVPEHRKFTEELHAISDQPDFQYKIIKKYMPELAPRLAGQLQDRARVQQKNRLTEKISNAGFLLIVVMFAVPWVFLAWCWRGKWEGPLIPDSFAGSWRIPDDLRRIKVFRKHYSVLFDCGQVYDKTDETESYTTTSTTSGRQYTVGDTTYIEAGTTQTHYHTIHYDRFALTTPDNRDTWASFVRGNFHARKGHIISYLSHDKALLVAYNHTTDSFVRLPDNYIFAHRFPGRWVWGATLFAIGGTMYLLKDYLAADYAAEMPGSWNNSIVRAVLVFAVISPIYIYLVKWLVQLARNLEFRWRYEPKLKKFFMQCTPELMQRFPPLPNVPDVRPA